MDLGDKFRQRRGTEMNTVSAGKKPYVLTRKLNSQFPRKAMQPCAEGSGRGSVNYMILLKVILSTLTKVNAMRCAGMILKVVLWVKYLNYLKSTVPRTTLLFDNHQFLFHRRRRFWGYCSINTEYVGVSRTHRHYLRSVIFLLNRGVALILQKPGLSKKKEKEKLSNKPAAQEAGTGSIRNVQGQAYIYTIIKITASESGQQSTKRI